MTLRAKVSYLLSLIIIIVMGASGLYYIHFFQKSLKNSILAGVEGVSDTTSQAISKFLADSLKETQAVALALPVEALEQKDAPVIRDRLKSLLAIFSKFENGMFILDKDGRLWVDYPQNPGAIGTDFSYREYFQRTLKEGKGIIGVPYVSGRTGKPVLTFTALLRGSDNRVLGVLGCSVQMLSSDALDGIRKVKIGKSGYLFVFDTSRMMILHPENERVLKPDIPPGANKLLDAAIAGFEGVGETVNSRGVPMLTAFKRIQGTDWIIGAQQLQDEAYLPIAQARKGLILAIILMVIVAVLSVTVAIRRITEPLTKLRQAVLFLGKEQSSESQRVSKELEKIRGSDEIGELANAFLDIARKLDETLMSLKMANNDWERTFNAVPDLIAIIDMQLNVVKINRAMADRLRVSAQDVVGLKCHKIFHGTDEPSKSCPHQRLLEDGQEHIEELVEEGLDGAFLITASPLRNQAGELLGSVHVARDISERNRMEEALRKGEKLYRSLFENMLNGLAYHKMLFEKDQPQDYIFLDVNSSFEDLTGLKNVVGKKVSEVIPGLRKSDPELFEIYGRVALTGKPERFETYVAALKKWFSISVYSPEKEYFVTVFDNITERKLAEEALLNNYSKLQETAQQLEQSRNMLQLIIESIPIRVFWKDRDLRFMGCNTLFARDAGFGHPEQLLGKDDFAMGWKDQADLYRTDDRQVMESRRPKLNIVEPQTTPTGGQIWLNTNKVPLQMPNGEVFGVLGLYEDITSRKQAEEALRSTRDYLENIFANSADSIGIVDRQGKFTHWNKAAEELYGYTFEELEGTSAIDLYADHGEFYEMLRQLHQCGFIRNYEINMKKKDGSVFPASLSIKILCNSDNKVIGSITVCRDLTETKRMMMHLQNEIHQHEQARQALLESEKKLINIIDFLPDATFVIDTNGKVIAWNKAIEEMTGVKAQDMVGKDNYEYALPFYGERRPILIDLVLEPDKGIEKYVEIKREDKALVAVGHFNNFRGKETYLFGKASPLIDSHGDIIGSIESVRDITALRQAELDRLQFSKLESIGTLAGGIAHDFNNILTAILGNIGLAMLNRKLGDEEIKRLVQAERGCLRAKELSGQLLTFAKGGTPIKKVTSLAKLVRESAKLALAGSKSRCEFSIPEYLWSVEADEGQINQVINNLLINADQAMPRGGIIKIEAENILVKDGSNLPLSEGKYVKLTLIDQGIGIPSQYLDKVFDPYFTTKQKGSGLGLATAYSIIIKHSGYMKVESQVGAGATFHIYLPALEDKGVAALQEQVTPSFGQGKVLVMDDDEKIREILCRMLGRLGYEADSAIDGSEVIEKFVKAKESGRQFDAVILDLTVPGGMGGKETIENLLRIDPQVKAIVSSGYSDDPIMANFKEYGFSEVIAKPYRVVELSKILQRVILKQGD